MEALPEVASRDRVVVVEPGRQATPEASMAEITLRVMVAMVWPPRSRAPASFTQEVAGAVVLAMALALMEQSGSAVLAAAGLVAAQMAITRTQPATLQREAQTWEAVVAVVLEMLTGLTRHEALLAVPAWSSSAYPQPIPPPSPQA